jgi:HK97 family phage major capsid protein
MEIEKQKQEIENLAKEIDSKIDKANAMAADAAEGVKNVDVALKNEVKNMIEKYQGLQADVDKVANALERKAMSNSKRKSFNDVLESDEGFKAFQKKKGRYSIELDTKATIVPGGSDDSLAFEGTVNEVVPADRVQGVIFDPDRTVHVRQFLMGGTTQSNIIRYVVESEYTDRTAMVAPGAAKPESDFVLEAKDSPVRKIAATLRLADEMLDDIPYLASYIGIRAPNKLRVEEDVKLLYGNGTGQELEGITTVASSFDATDFVGLVGTANRYDVLIAALNNVRLAEYNPTAIMLNPTDFAIMRLEKSSSDGHYLFPEIRLNGQVPNLNGVPIIQNTAITKGDFLIGDFVRGAQYFDRKGLTVEFFDQDRDNVQKNLITVRVEERLALCVYRPTAFVYDTFATALAALDASA